MDTIEEQLGAAGVGFDEEGNLIDAEGELILNDDGDPINSADVLGGTGVGEDGDDG